MAASQSGGENSKRFVAKKNSPEQALNNNSVHKGNCKDLLKVRPERELEKYLLWKNGKQGGAERKTFKPSACQVLREVKEFLPLMQQAQEELSSSECNIEDVNDVGTYINMDIQLVELENNDSSSESEGEDDESDGNIGEVTENNLVLKTAEKNKKPLIEDIT